MKHVYLAPHLDDAVLSCGGAIHRHVAVGDPVHVVTVFAGGIRSARPPSSFAQLQHEYWGHPPRPMALRRAEDLAAATRLGATAQHLDYPDAVYRADAGGNWLYTGEAAIFGALHPADPLVGEGSRALAGQLADLLDDETTAYAPLGIGHHVDHQILHAAAKRLVDRGHRLAFYEDYPYAEEVEATETTVDWGVQVVALTPADVAAKVSALGYYRTQMRALFGGAEAMPSRIWAFAATRSPEARLAERIWWSLEREL